MFVICGTSQEPSSSDMYFWKVTIKSESTLAQRLDRFGQFTNQLMSQSVKWEEIESVIRTERVRDRWPWLRQLKNYLRDDVHTWVKMTITMEALDKPIDFIQMFLKREGHQYSEEWLCSEGLHRPTGPAKTTRLFGKTKSEWHLKGHPVPSFGSILRKKTPQRCIDYLSLVKNDPDRIFAIRELAKENIINFREDIIESFELMVAT